MNFSEIFITIIIMMFLMGFTAIYLSEIKPDIEALAIKTKLIQEKIYQLEFRWERKQQEDKEWTKRANEMLSVEHLNKLVKEHIDGTSMPIKDKIEEVVEEYNAHLTKLKENAYRIKKEAGTIKEILIYEEELDYIISHMNHLYGNSKKGA